MEEFISRPVICPLLIGRSSALASLYQIGVEVREGKGQVITIGGEAGVGKSRLLNQVKANLTKEGFVVLQGNCFEGDNLLPYAPLLDLFRGFVQSQKPEIISQLLGADGGELVRLFPEIGLWLPGAISTTSEGEPEKRRFMEILARVVLRFCERQPLLLIIEDLHWSDDTTLDFLLFLSRLLSSKPLLVLLTYRNDEISTALRHFLAGLIRERRTTELQLARLTLPQVENMVQAIFERREPLQPRFVEAMYNLTDGNPFFVEEVLKSLSTKVETLGSILDREWEPKILNEIQLSVGILDAVYSRSTSLHPDSRELLNMLAVAGRRFDFKLLEALSSKDEKALTVLLAELVGAQLVVEEAADVFAFRHALTRQAIYSQLLTRQRVGLHRQVAKVMEQLYKDNLDTHAGELAYHYYEAGEWKSCFHYAQLGGYRALAMYAPRAAIEHFGRALETARHQGLTPPPTIYRARGEAYSILGDFESSLANLEAALQIARSTGEQQEEWKVLCELGKLWASRNYDQTGQYYQSALELARAKGDPAIIGHSLNLVGNWHTNLEQAYQALRYHHEALELFQGLGDQAGMAETFDLLGLTYNEIGDMMQSASYYQQALPLFEKLNQRHRLASSLSMLTVCRGSKIHEAEIAAPASFAEAVRDGERALKLSQASGWKAGEAFALLSLGIYLGYQGNYNRARELLAASLKIALEIEHHQWIIASKINLGIIYLDLFALPQAQIELEEALGMAKRSGSGIWLKQASALLADVYCLQQRYDLARGTLASLLTPEFSDLTAQQRMHWHSRAKLAVAQNEAALGLEMVERLIASTNNLKQGEVIPALWKLRGEALLSLQREAEAEITLLAAEEAARTRNLKPLLWRIQLSLGRLYSVQGRGGEARNSFSSAWQIGQELAASLPDQTIAKNFIKQVANMLPAPYSAQPPKASLKLGGLTPREREVAALVSQGKSNREIATHLIVSERTVSTHVSNILTKLDFSSRTQIATWATENGLTTSSSE